MGKVRPGPPTAGRWWLARTAALCGLGVPLGLRHELGLQPGRQKPSQEGRFSFWARHKRQW